MFIKIIVINDKFSSSTLMVYGYENLVTQIPTYQSVSYAVQRSWWFFFENV